MLEIKEEFKKLIPPLSVEEHEQLKENLLNHGCLDSLKSWHSFIVDGHNRHEICIENNIPFKVEELKGIESEHDVKIWIVHNQFGRRNLSPYSRAELALQLEEFYKEKAKLRQGTRTDLDSNMCANLHRSERTTQGLSKLANLSARTIDTAKSIAEHGTEELKVLARAGSLSVSTASDIATLPEAEQRRIAALSEKEILAKAKEIRSERQSERRKERVDKIVSISEGNRELNGDKKYPLIYADPPWKYQFVESETRQIENHYPTMELNDICELPIYKIAMEDCILFLWATSPKLGEALQVMDSWGFEYKSCFVWVKDKIGMGYYARQRHELLLVGTRGSIPVPEPSDRHDSVIESPRLEHSQKPGIFYEMIEKMYPNFPKLELFARGSRTGWDAWGNQSDSQLPEQVKSIA